MMLSHTVPRIMIQQILVSTLIRGKFWIRGGNFNRDFIYRVWSLNNIHITLAVSWCDQTASKICKVIFYHNLTSYSNMAVACNLVDLNCSFLKNNCMRMLYN